MMCGGVGSAKPVDDEVKAVLIEVILYFSNLKCSFFCIIITLTNFSKHDKDHK